MRRHRSHHALVLVGALAALWATTARGQSTRLAMPDWVRSVEVRRGGTTIRARPTTGSGRRGTVQIGTRLPALGRVLGEGCPGGEWIQVGADAFVCESLVGFSPQPPGGDPLPRLAEGALTPRMHAFVATDGTWAYSHPNDYFADRWTESLGQGFGLAIVERREVGGVDMARTLSGLWVPANELRWARPSDFQGVELEGEVALTSIGWIRNERAPMRAAARGPIVERGARLMRVQIAAEAPHGMLELTDGRFVRTNDVARPRPANVPADVEPGARWIDVDTHTQVLTAYVGERPVYVTVVSTGRPRTATPTGVFRIWVKLAEDDMDDLEREDIAENYAIQAVPWVQYFHESIGLHAAFWHDRFGHPRSHGCVNLAPRDARWLFEFTQPNLPPGWDAILPQGAARGTVVRVR